MKSSWWSVARISPDEVRKLTDGRGVDAVIDNVGTPVFRAVRRSVADDGRIVLVGQLTGEFVSINPAQLFLRNVSILSAKGVSRAQLADALDLVARGRIKPVVENIYRARRRRRGPRAGREPAVLWAGWCSSRTDPTANATIELDQKEPPMPSANDARLTPAKR